MDCRQVFAMTAQIPSIQSGIYEHYKGKLYEVYGVCRHSETNEALVVYRTLYGDYSLWVRPLDMFVETIEMDGISKPRFKWVKSLSDTAAPLLHKKNV